MNFPRIFLTAAVLLATLTGMKPEGTRALPEQPALPAWKSFVVQFTRETDPTQPSCTFAGRVEHLSSGRRAHFDSPQALVEILRQLLEELGKAPA